MTDLGTFNPAAATLSNSRIKRMTTNSITINSIEELPAGAQWLEAMIAQWGAKIVALYGDMGVGKTTLISEFCRQKGITQGVSSPTFAIINEYIEPNAEKIYHFDCYRFESEQEAMDIGVFDYFDSGALCFIEWPERIEGILAQCDILKIEITALSPTSRKIEVKA